ncbi:RNA polymerase sigma factor RpoD/SigA [bacterium]
MKFQFKREVFQTYLNQINKIPSIPEAEFPYLYKEIKKGNDKAKRRLVEGNFKLVIAIASKYQNMGLSMMDLIEEGNLGLMKAIDKYEEQKGAKFSTYASWWIRQSIRRGIDNYGKTIRIPTYAVENMRKWILYWDEISKKEGPKPTLEKMAEDLKLTIKEVKNIIYTLEVSRGITSLDVPITEDDNVYIGDLLINEAIEDSPEDILEKEIDIESVNDVLKILTEKEKKIIIERFGLDGDKTRTLADIGEELGVSRERVRQIAESAINKMRRFFQRSKFV